MDYTTIKLTDPTVPVFGSIQKFADQALQQAMMESLKAVDIEGKKFAILAHVEVDSWRVTQTMAAKLGDHWSIVEGAYKERGVKDGWKVGFNVLASW